MQFRDTNGAQQAMRTASKNILYVVVNSRAYDSANLNTATPIWKILLIAADILIAALLALLMFFGVKKFKKESAIEKAVAEAEAAKAAENQSNSDSICSHNEYNTADDGKTV